MNSLGTECILGNWRFAGVLPAQTRFKSKIEIEDEGVSFFPTLADGDSSLWVAAPHSILHCTFLRPVAGFLLAGHHLSVTLADALAVRVRVELLTGHKVLTSVAAAALVQRHAAILERQDNLFSTSQ